jgi:hypothetical protein
MYEVNMTAEQLKLHPTPHIALEALRDQLKALLDEDQQKYEWYVIHSTNADTGFRMTAELDEARKQHFIANPL